jgi:hypothetical protein
MAVLGLGLVVGALPAGASARLAAKSTPEAFRGKNPTTTDSTTPPSTVTVKPTSTTMARPAPARSHVPKVELPTTTSTLQAPILGPPGPSANSGTPSSTTTPARNPHVVEGEVAPTTTSTEVSNTVVGNIGQGTGPKPGSPVKQPVTRRPTRTLGTTGATTRPLLILAGGTLLLGALAVAFGAPRPVPATGGGTSALARRRRPPVRRTLPGWESGVPLDPQGRERVRQRVQDRQNRPRVRLPGGARGA